MYRWVIAWRWLKNLPILWISVFGVLLGVASILVVDSIFNGVLHELEVVWRGTTSDLVVQTLAPPDQAGTAMPTEAILKAVRGCEGVVGAAPRLRRPCLLPPDRRLPEVIAIGAISRRSLIDVQGIEPADESSVTDFQSYLAAVPRDQQVPDIARPFDRDPAGDARGPAIPILLGERCAKALKLARGDRIELMTLPDASEGSSDFRETTGQFVVVGLFKTGYLIEDLTKAYVARADLQRFCGTSATSTEIAVRVRPDADLEDVRERINAAVRPFELFRWFPQPVARWDELQSTVHRQIEEQRKVLDLVLFFVVIVAGFNLLVSLNLLVTEKFRDVGTLGALGGSSAGIASIFTALGTLVTLFGAGLGLAVGTALARHVNAVHDLIASWIGRRLWDADVYLFEKIPVRIEPAVVVASVAATFVVTLVFAFFASLRAARLDVVEALRHE